MSIFSLKKKIFIINNSNLSVTKIITNSATISMKEIIIFYFENKSFKTVINNSEKTNIIILYVVLASK